MKRFFRNLAVSYIRTKFKILSAVSKKKAAQAAFDLFCTPPTRNNVNLAPVFSTGELITYPFGDFIIRGYRWNDKGTHTVLIIHGFESSIVNFHRYISAFTKAGLRVLAFDAPAHGLSSGNRINAIVYRDFLKDLHERFGPIERFVSHSFGGLALTLALAEIPHSRSTKLVLIAPMTKTATAIDQFFRVIDIKDPEVRNEFERIIFNFAQQPVEWFSIIRAMREIDAEVLWVHDEGDRVTPLSDANDIINGSHQNIHFVITKGLGHSAIYRDTIIVEKVSKFLTD